MMKTLGLLGGSSWHSTIEYYRNINQMVNDHFGNNTNPPLVLFNLNQALLHRYQNEGNWSAIATELVKAGERLQASGAEALIFCANTPHKVYDEVQKGLEIPILHIADAMAQEIKSRGIGTVSFIGTRFSMQHDFIMGRYRQQGIEVISPNTTEVIMEIHRIIHQELCLGKVIPSSKQYLISLIEGMVAQGAEAVVLGCTEFPIIIKEGDLNIPILDTVQVHAEMAARYILSE